MVLHGAGLVAAISTSPGEVEFTKKRSRRFHILLCVLDTFVTYFGAIHNLSSRNIQKAVYDATTR